MIRICRPRRIGGFPSDQRDPEQAAIRRQMRMKMRKAIADLPESLRLPLILSHYQQMGYDEVAKVLDLSLAAVKVRIHRARLLLGEKLMRQSCNQQGNGRVS